jgi:hypothetical protein
MEKIMSLKTLDTVIALIVVLLVLSLIVQSIQAVIKKWCKLKSRSILDSLGDLFEYVDSQTVANKSSATLIAEIKQEFKKLGRVSFVRKTPMVDSIAKDDLLKILDRLNATALNPKVETWYDTTMQGFEERYARHMKSIAICISIVLVLFLNANFFQVYRNIATNEVLRNSLLERRDQIQRQLNDRSSQFTDQQSQAIKEQLNSELKELQSTMDESLTFGFSPIRSQQLTDFLVARGDWQSVSFTDRLGHAFKALVGWSIMVMLLSVGAPFWQDALESLFGIKSLLRKKSNTMNVEEMSGGQSRP